MHAYRHSYSISNRKSRLLIAAKLIAQFRTGLPSSHLYEMAPGCYDFLIGTLENPGLARELSAFTNIPADDVQASADAIIHRLLFNSENNPFISLGLEENASAAEAARRWKRLIILYHPDKYPNQTKYEEKAKKINQAYAELGRIKEKGVHHEVIRNVRRTSPSPNNRALFLKYMRPLPALILAIAVIMAILAVLLLIARSQKRSTFHTPAERLTIARIVHAERHPVQ